MSAFTPTLVLAVVQSELAEGITTEMARAQVIKFFSDASMTQPLTFTAKTVIVAETQGTDDEIILKDFTAIVAARYTIGSSFFLKFTTGDVVEIDFITI